jgi:hypothetical protein
MILNVITMELRFIPAPIANIYAQRKSVSWNTDLTDDSLFFMVGKLVADGDTQFVRSIYTLLTLDK